MEQYKDGTLFAPVAIKTDDFMKGMLGKNYHMILMSLVVIVIIYMMCSGGLVGSIGSQGSIQHRSKNPNGDFLGSAMASIPQCVRLGMDGEQVSWENFGCMGNKFIRGGAFDQTASNRNMIDVTGADLGFLRIDNPQYGNAYNLQMDNYLMANKAHQLGGCSSGACEGLVPDRDMDYVPAGSGRYGGSTSTWGQWVNKHPLTALASLKASDNAWGNYSSCNGGNNNGFKYNFPDHTNYGNTSMKWQNYGDTAKTWDEGTLQKMVHHGGN